MPRKITRTDCDNLLEKFRTFLARFSFPSAGCRINIDSEDDWSITLAVPQPNFGCRRCSVDGADDYVSRFFSEIGVDEERSVFFGLDDESKCLEWYFTHPDTPKDVIARMDAEDEKREKEEIESRKRLEEDKSKNAKPGIVPIPMKQNVGRDECFLVLKKCYFDDIKSGDKTVEFREVNQYYADKLLGKEKPLKFVKFQLGYGGPGHAAPEQMKFEIDSIVLVDDFMDEFPAYTNGVPTASEDLPKGFNPTMYGIKLGQRVF
jgi:hypothetical protein